MGKFLGGLAIGFLAVGCVGGGGGNGGPSTNGPGGGGGTGGPGIQINATTYRTYAKHVFNPYPFPVAVYVDNTQQGFLAPQAYGIVNLTEGTHVVTLMNAYGQRQEFELTGGDEEHHEHDRKRHARKRPAHTDDSDDNPDDAAEPDPKADN